MRGALNCKGLQQAGQTGMTLLLDDPRISRMEMEGGRESDSKAKVSTMSSPVGAQQNAHGRRSFLPRSLSSALSVTRPPLQWRSRGRLQLRHPDQNRIERHSPYHVVSYAPKEWCGGYALVGFVWRGRGQHDVSRFLDRGGLSGEQYHDNLDRWKLLETRTKRNVAVASNHHHQTGWPGRWW